MSGDHALNPQWTASHVMAGADPRLKIKLKPAAVLIPVVDHGDHASVLLTTRNAQMRSHSGQVAFPGGKIDAEDLSPEHAALREAHEEIGLDARQTQTLGRLPQYMTGSGYTITPVLAVIRTPFELHANLDEVADILKCRCIFLWILSSISARAGCLQGMSGFSMPSIIRIGISGAQQRGLSAASMKGSMRE